MGCVSRGRQERPSKEMALSLSDGKRVLEESCLGKRNCKCKGPEG